MPTYVQLLLTDEETAFVDAARPSTTPRTAYLRGLVAREKERAEKRAADLLPETKPTKKKGKR